jgi:hypothetical protein
LDADTRKQPWLKEATGCVGPTDTAQSHIQIFSNTALSAKCEAASCTIQGDASTKAWVAQAFAKQSKAKCRDIRADSCTGETSCGGSACLVAGTPLLLAIDSRDVWKQHDAELAGICGASNFGVSAESAFVGSVLFLQNVLSTGTCENMPCEQQYYAAEFLATKAGDYSLYVSLNRQAVKAWAHVVSVDAAPVELPACVVNGVGTDPTMLSIAKLCLPPGSACKSLPKKQLKFTVELFDRFKNPRLDRDVVSVSPDASLCTVSDASPGYAKCAKYNPGNKYWEVNFQEQKPSGAVKVNFLVEIATSQFPLLSFTYTAQPPDPAYIKPFLHEGPAPNSTMTAGGLDHFTVVVDDGRCNTGVYIPSTGCVEAFGLATVVAISATMEDKWRGSDGQATAPCSCVPEFDGPGCDPDKAACEANPFAVVVPGIWAHDTEQIHSQTTRVQNSSPGQPCNAPAGMAHPTCLDFMFNPTAVGVYSVDMVILGWAGPPLPPNPSLGGEEGGWSESPPWQLRVSPAALKVTKSGPGGPQYAESEAGRLNLFYVVPRDQYGNVRDQQSAHGFENHVDMLTVTITCDSSAQAQNRSCEDGLSSKVLSSGNVETNPRYKQPFWDTRLHRYEVQQRITVAGVYKFAIRLGGELLSVHQLPAVSHPGTVTVKPAELDVNNTIGCGDLQGNSAGPRSLQPADTYAAQVNHYCFTARDHFGNVRLKNDTCLSEVSPAHSSNDVRCSWIDERGVYNVQFSTHQSLSDGYSLAVSIGMSANTAAAAVNSLTNSPYAVFVRPAALAVHKCIAPPTGSDGPGFSSTEAGQRSEFSVTPRDEYGNRRCQTIYGLSDVLSARAVPLAMLTVYESSAAAGSVATEHNITNGDGVEWQSADNRCPMDGAGANFSAALTLDIAGEYTVHIKLADQGATHSLLPVAPTEIPRAPFNIRVVPAWADPDASRVEGTDDNTNNCVRTTACSSWPGTELKFTIVVTDKFGNIRHPENRVDTTAQHDRCSLIVSNTDTFGGATQVVPAGLIGEWDNTGGHYKVTLATLHDDSVEVKVQLRVWNGTQDSTSKFTKFVYTAAKTNAAAIVKNMTIEVLPRLQITAGVVNSLTLKIQDDACQPAPHPCTEDQLYLPKKPALLCDDQGPIPGSVALPGSCEPRSVCLQKCSGSGCPCTRMCRGNGCPCTKKGFWGNCKSRDTTRCDAYDRSHCVRSEMQCGARCTRTVPVQCPKYKYTPDTGCVTLRHLSTDVQIHTENKTGDAGAACEADDHIHKKPAWKKENDRLPCASGTNTVCMNYTFTITVAGTYTVWLNISGGDLLDDARGLKQWLITVNPAGLDFKNTGSFAGSGKTRTDEGPRSIVTTPVFPPLQPIPWCTSVDECRAGMYQTVAGGINKFGVVPRDKYGNVRVQTDRTLTLDHRDIFTVNFTSTGVRSQAQTWRTVGDADQSFAEPHHADTRWDAATSRFIAETPGPVSPTVTGEYAISVHFFDQVRQAEGAIPYTPLAIFTRPADLNVTWNSGIFPTMFKETEAGRHSSFAVLPRDRYNNIRNLTELSLTDEMSVTLTGKQWPDKYRLVNTVNFSWQGNRILPMVDHIEPPVTAVGPPCQPTRLGAVECCPGVDPTIPCGCYPQHGMAFVCPMVPHFRAEFTVTVAGQYHVVVKLSDMDHHLGLQPISEADIPGSPFAITVIAAALFIPNTQNKTFEHTFVGVSNTFSFQAQDRFGNVRHNNDTVRAELSLNRSDALETHTFISTLGVWNSTSHYYDVKFGTEESIRWDDPFHYWYSVTVTLAQCSETNQSPAAKQCQPTLDTEPVRKPLLLSPFHILVYPAPLNVSAGHSGPGPEFDETEAGRVSFFAVVPRDRYNNILAIRELGLTVNLSVAMTGPDRSQVYGQQVGDEARYACQQVHASYEGKPVETRAAWKHHSSKDYGDYPTISPDSQHPDCLTIGWDPVGKTTMKPGWDRLGHHPMHFDTKFNLTISGVYTFDVWLSDQNKHAEVSVLPTPLPKSPFRCMTIVFITRCNELFDSCVLVYLQHHGHSSRIG